MEAQTVEKMISLYSEIKNLKLVGEQMGIPWQTVYWWLKKQGVAVTGDKRVYGSDKDRMAAKYEDLFHTLVPQAVPENDREFQAKYDFTVGGYTVDIKSATRSSMCSRSNHLNYRWAFSTKKNMDADFMVCFCLEGSTKENHVNRILLIPNEFCRDKQTISVSCNTSKWFEFEVTEQGLVKFFQESQY